MPFSKCLRAKIYSNMNVYFDPQGCQTLLLKESDPLFFSLGSWTNRENYKGDDSAKNAGVANVVNVCTSSVMLYISTKFCEMI